MPAAVVKGILLSLGILAALGFAAYENPEIQRWIEEQRRKIAELLRSIGEELDPQSRREAEAFAFEGRTPQRPQGDARQETARSENHEPATDAVVATGRTTEHGVIRRAPLQMMRDAQEAEERQRLGEEYLAQRNKQMQEMKERRQNVSKSIVLEGPSFGSLVDDNGNLRSEEKQPMVEVAETPVPVEEVNNPFGDEHELERSTTPKPPVPPKIALEESIRLEEVAPMPVQEAAAVPLQDDVSVSQPPGAFPTQDVPASDAHADLTYEEQLALAISLSEQEARSQPQSYDLGASTDETELRNAIEASLREHSREQLVDVSEPSNAMEASIMSEEDLYNATPHLTRAKLVDFNAQLAPLLPIARAMPYDPVREAARSSNQPDEAASFYSAHDGSFVNSSLPSLHNASWLRPVKDNDTETLRSGTRTPTEASIVSYPSDEESSNKAAPLAEASRNASHSSVEAIDVEDVDMDVISDDGIATPDSWTEVGSHDGDSEHEMQSTPA